MAGCGSADLPASTGVVERFLVSTDDYTTGDWPGAAAPDFRVWVWNEKTEGRADGELCPSNEIENDVWRCSVGPLTGVFLVEDARVLTPEVSPLQALLHVDEAADTTEAFVSPMSHFIAAYARYLGEAQGLPIADALRDATERFRPFMLEADNPYASPASPTPRLATDAERQALVLEGLTRVAAQYALASFHKTRIVSAVLAQSLRTDGQFQDVEVQTASTSITLWREFIRRDLALAVLDMAEALDMPAAECTPAYRGTDQRSGGAALWFCECRTAAGLSEHYRSLPLVPSVFKRKDSEPLIGSGSF